MSREALNDINYTYLFCTKHMALFVLSLIQLIELRPFLIELSEVFWGNEHLRATKAPQVTR